MPTFRSNLIRTASKLPKGDPTRKAFLQALVTGKEASLKDGPVGRVLDKYWNMIHDFENELEATIQDYGDAMSYGGGPAERDAKDMVKRIQAVHKAVEALSMKAFSTLFDAESRFVKKFGEPEDYVIQQRNEMFPR